MTNTQKQANLEAKRLVQLFCSQMWMQGKTKKEFELAQACAVICARKMLKEFKMWQTAKTIKILIKHHQILKALPQSIYSLKFKK